MSLSSRLLIATTFLATALPVSAAYKCVNAAGKVEYMDTPCPNTTTSTTVRTDRANSLDTSHGNFLDRMAGSQLECDAAKETLSHKNSSANRAAMRQACALPEPERAPRTHTNCTNQSQSIGGGMAVGSSNCVTR